MRPGAPLKLALLMDPREEGWPSMDLVGEALQEELSALRSEVTVTGSASAHAAPRPAPAGSRRRAAFNADRLLTRFGAYPARPAGAGPV